MEVPPLQDAGSLGGTWAEGLVDPGRPEREVLGVVRNREETSVLACVLLAPRAWNSLLRIFKET